VSQGVEAVSVVKLGEFGRGPKCRDGSTSGLKLAIADKPFQKRAYLDAAGAGGANLFRLSLDNTASFLPIVGRTHAQCRPAGNLEGLGISCQFANGFDFQVSEFVECELDELTRRIGSKYTSSTLLSELACRH
jgi:hypothetical protein